MISNIYFIWTFFKSFLPPVPSPQASVFSRRLILVGPEKPLTLGGCIEHAAIFSGIGAVPKQGAKEHAKLHSVILIPQQAHLYQLLYS
jgi:hypothetical protein